MHMLYTEPQIARSTLAAVRNRSTLSRIVNQDFSQDFIPGRGGAITIKSPVYMADARVYTAADRAADRSITYSDLYEPYRSMKITDQIYQAVKLPDNFVTFDLTAMETQVIAPMAETVADALNNEVVKAFESVPAGLTAQDRGAKNKLFSTDGTAYDTAADLKAADKVFNGMGLGLSTRFKNENLKADDHSGVLPAIRYAVNLLNSRGVKPQDRYLVVGAGWAAALRATPSLTKVNEAGTDGLLRENILGRLYGLTVVEDNVIDAYAAYAYKMDAITLASRVSAPPKGAAFSATISQDGFSLRYLHDYDVDKLQDRAVIDTFAKAEVLDLQRIVKLTGKEGMDEPKTNVRAGP